MKEVVLPFYAKLALILISLVILGYLAIIGHRILAPLFFAFLFAVLLLPACSFLEKKWKFPRGLAAILSLVVLIVVVASILFFLGSQISSLLQDWPKLRTEATASIQELQKWIQQIFHINADKQITYIHNTTSKLLSSTASVIGTTVLTLSSTVLFYVFILLFTFFMLINRSHLLDFLVRVFREENAVIVYDIVERIKEVIKQYVLGLFFQMGIVSVIACIAFEIIGINYAILLGMLTGILNVIPYLGIFTALLLSFLITFATAGISKALIVAVAVFIIHLLDSNIIMPLVVGGKVKVNPMIVVIGIIVGEMIWGISGMFLCIPYIAILKIIFDRIEPLQPWGTLLGHEEKEPKQTLALKERLRSRFLSHSRRE